jgi:excisionase family DNA binding protein
MQERLLTVEEVASLTGWHYMTVYRKGLAGKIPGRVKLDNSVRFKESKINEWLENPNKEIQSSGE